MTLMLCQAYHKHICLSQLLTNYLPYSDPLIMFGLSGQGYFRFHIVTSFLHIWLYHGLRKIAVPWTLVICPLLSYYILIVTDGLFVIVLMFYKSFM
jgi:hypothetical protein